MEDIYLKIQALAAKSDPLGNTLKIRLEEEVIYIDGIGDTNQVHREDLEAQCTLITKTDHFRSLMSGSLNPMMAVMTGKLKIEGDMGIAMKLTRIIG